MISALGYPTAKGIIRKSRDDVPERSKEDSIVGKNQAGGNDGLEIVLGKEGANDLAQRKYEQVCGRHNGTFPQINGTLSREEVDS